MLNILQEATKLVDVGVVDSENYNFHLEGYEFVLQQAKDMNKCLEQFYSSINSRSNILTENVLLTESFDTFTGKIREIVSKFLKFIKRIFDKFIAQMSALFRSEKYIEKNKNELYKFTSDMDFKIQGYKFTKLMDDIPLSNAYESFFDSKSLKLKDFISTKNIKNITTKYDSFMDGLEENYEAFRAEVLNMKGDYLTASQFDDELFTIFRDDSKTTSEIEITETEVSESLTQFIGYKNHLKAIEKTRDEIIRDYTRLERDLNRLISIKDGKLSYNRADDISDYSGGQLDKFDDQSYDDDDDNTLSTYNIDTGNATAKASSAKKRKMINDKLSQFIKAKATQVNKYSSIHSLAFTAKIQAVKDNFIQNKIILTKALVRIKGRKDK